MGIVIKLFIGDNSSELNVIVLKDHVKHHRLAENQSNIVADFQVPLKLIYEDDGDNIDCADCKTESLHSKSDAEEDRPILEDNFVDMGNFCFNDTDFYVSEREDSLTTDSLFRENDTQSLQDDVKVVRSAQSVLKQDGSSLNHSSHDLLVLPCTNRNITAVNNQVGMSTPRHKKVTGRINSKVQRAGTRNRKSTRVKNDSEILDSKSEENIKTYGGRISSLAEKNKNRRHSRYNRYNATLPAQQELKRDSSTDNIPQRLRVTISDLFKMKSNDAAVTTERNAMSRTRGTLTEHEVSELKSVTSYESRVNGSNRHEPTKRRRTKDVPVATKLKSESTYHQTEIVASEAEGNHKIRKSARIKIENHKYRSYIDDFKKSSKSLIQDNRDSNHLILERHFSTVLPKEPGSQCLAKKTTEFAKAEMESSRDGKNSENSIEKLDVQDEGGQENMFASASSRRGANKENRSTESKENRVCENDASVIHQSSETKNLFLSLEPSRFILKPATVTVNRCDQAASTTIESQVNDSEDNNNIDLKTSVEIAKLQFNGPIVKIDRATKTNLTGLTTTDNMSPDHSVKYSVPPVLQPTEKIPPESDVNEKNSENPNSSSLERGFRVNRGKTNRLQQHVFSCVVCEYSSNRKYDMRRHTRISHPKEYICDTCEYKTLHARLYVVHKKRHRKGASYCCHHCSYICDRQSELDNHLRKHANEKPFVCPMCDYISSRKHFLDQHISNAHNKNA